jgi:hypothetical protein
MAADPAVVTAIGDGGLAVKDTVLGAATTILPYAAGLIALGVGWKVIRRFVHL